MRMLCAAESGPLAPPQPWRSAEPHSAPSLPAAHFSTEIFSLAARARTNAEPVNPEKPHQGVASQKTAPHQAKIACNSTTALGLSWQWQSGTASGARVTYDYDAWGNAVNTAGSTPNVYLYGGDQYDTDLGLYYLRARYFNPLTGRFLTRDPYQPCGCASCGRDPATLHKYLYAAADPVNHSDPTGNYAIPLPRQGPGALEYTFLLAITMSAIVEMERTGMGENTVWKKTNRSLQCAVDLERCIEKYSPPYGPPGPRGGRPKRPWPPKVDCGDCAARCEKNANEFPDSDPWPYDKCPL